MNTTSTRMPFFYDRRAAAMPNSPPRGLQSSNKGIQHKNQGKYSTPANRNTTKANKKGIEVEAPRHNRHKRPPMATTASSQPNSPLGGLHCGNRGLLYRNRGRGSTTQPP